MKYLKATLFLVILKQTIAFGQLDPLNSQYLSNQTLINPAYVGVHDFFLGMLSSRGQWVGIDGAPFTNTLSVSSSFNDQMGAGLLLINDNFGINHEIEVNLQYSYKVNWMNHSLSFGLQTGWGQQSVNFSELSLEGNDPNIPNSSSSVSTQNFGTGLFLNHEKYYVGVSVPRILKVNLAPENAKEALYKRHYYLSAGYVFDYISHIKIKPSILVRAVETEQVFVDINGQIIFNDVVWLGVSLTNFNAAGFNFQYVEGDARFGYAFQLPINNLASASFGTHELMLAFDIELLKRHSLRQRYF